MSSRIGHQLPNPSATYQPQVLPTSTLPFALTSDVVATNRIIVIGSDPDNNRLWGRDGTSGNLSQSDDNGSTWTHGKGMPTGIRYNNLTKMVRFGSHFYLTADDAAGNWYVYRCPAVAAATAFTWEATPVFSFRTDANNIVRTCFSAGSQYLYLAEYTSVASITGGPRIYRSADGVTWEQVYSDPTARHAHAILEDPYNEGHVYATMGDNGTTNSVLRSTDHGATWATIISSSTNMWQSVQISFSRRFVWLAMDRIGGTVAVFDRDELVPRIAASNLPYNTAVPGAAASTDRFYLIGYFGAVDPDTESYYYAAQDTSSGGNKYGIFWLSHVGGRLELLDAPAGSLNEVFIANGKVWCGTRTRPLITQQYAPG